MPPNAFSKRPLATERVPWLRGTLRLPGDTIVSSLALCCAALARGNSMIEGAPQSPETAGLADALAALGARVEAASERLYITGLGAGGLLEPRVTLDLRDSPLGSRLVMGLAGIYYFPTAIYHNEETGTRLTNQLLALLAEFDIAASVDPSGRLPLRLRGPKRGMPADLTLPPDGPLAKATLLFAALGVPGISSLVEPAPGWDHAERMLNQFGAEITIASAGSGKRIEIAGLKEFKAQQIAVPADPSLAALGAVAASIVPASEILIENVLVNPARTAVLSALVALGARIEAHNLRVVHGEEVADLSVRHEGMKGIALGSQHVGTLIDQLPLLAVAAAFAEGETTFHLPPNLPLLDRARLAALARGLALCGVKAQAEEETFSVHGTSDVKGGATIVADDDDAMALAFLVLGMGAREQVTIADPSVIERRFPGFVGRFENIGASFIRDADAIGEDRGE